MLALLARSAGRPTGRAVLGVLAMAAVIMGIGAPPPLRQALLDRPWMVLALALPVIGHTLWASARAWRTLGGAAQPGESRWIAAAAQFMPPALARFAATELLMIHIALFRVGGAADIPPGARGFAYHRHLAPMCTAL